MRKPPAATAVASGSEPVAYPTAAEATAVVTRCPPGLMLSNDGQALCQRRVSSRCFQHSYILRRRPEDGGKNVSEYLAVAIFAAFIVAFAVVSLGVAWLLRPSRPDAIKLDNYECGAEPIGSAWVQFPVWCYL